MLERASGQFTIDGQVEDIHGGFGGAARIARISQTCRFSGELEGESMAEFTAVLPRESDGSFHGFQRVSGTLGEREGTFVLSVTGEIHKGQPRGSWTIVPKSGSGDFAHIRGSGTFSLPDGKPGRYQLEFDLRKPRAAKAPVESAEKPMTRPDEIVEAPVAAVETSTPIPGTPVRKPRAKKIEPPVEVAPEASVTRARSRKVEETPPDPVVAAAPKQKRPRVRNAEPAVEEALPIASEPAKAQPRRTRKPKSSVAELAEGERAPQPKRSRGRKAEPVVPPQAVAEPAPKSRRSRSRQTEVPIPPASVSESEPKPRRSRKPAPTGTPSEPVVTTAEPVQELGAAKPVGRKKADSSEPIALPAAETPLPRKRRAKAA